MSRQRHHLNLCIRLIFIVILTVVLAGANPVQAATVTVDTLLNAMGITPSVIDGNHPFSDISDHWAEAYIEELFDQGITGGYPDGTYRLENQITRAEMAVFLVNTFSIPLP